MHTSAACLDSSLLAEQLVRSHAALCFADSSELMLHEVSLTKRFELLRTNVYGNIHAVLGGVVQACQVDSSGQQQQRQRKQEHTRAQLWRRFFLVMPYARLHAYLTKQLAAAVQFQEADPFPDCKERTMSGFQASG
jgi:hypothetical protein